MVTIEGVITDVLSREGGFIDDPLDRGSATNRGITAATLGEYRRLGRPATVDEVRALTEAEARAIYRDRYVRAPGFDALPDWLLPIVVDDAVLSGTKTAIKTLQRVVGVVDDGLLGPKTKAAVVMKDPEATIRALVKARVLRFARIVENNPTQSRFIVGWCARALSFL